MTIKTIRNEPPIITNEFLIISNEQFGISNEFYSITKEQYTISNEHPTSSNEFPITSNEFPTTSNEFPSEFWLVLVLLYCNGLLFCFNHNLGKNNEMDWYTILKRMNSKKKLYQENLNNIKNPIHCMGLLIIGHFN